jgi:hypothetical protein
MPILGTVASQFSGKSFGSFDSIATITVGSGGTSNIEFTSIPATYTHLQVRVLHKNSTANNGFDIQLNGDTTSGRYTIHALVGDASSASTVSNGSNNFGRLYGLGNQWGSAIIDILDYTDTNKKRTVRAVCGVDTNGSGVLSLDSFLYTQTTAVSSIKCFPSASATWSEYSHFALYGIKGA